MNIFTLVCSECNHTDKAVSWDKLAEEMAWHMVWDHPQRRAMIFAASNGESMQMCEIEVSPLTVDQMGRLAEFDAQIGSIKHG